MNSELCCLTPDDLLAIVTPMQDAARLAGASLAHKFNQRDALAVQYKGPSDFVSAADTEAEQIIIRHLRHKLPAQWTNIAFLGEETGESGNAASHLQIVMDPLDGTNNFLHGVAHFSVALALLQDGEVVAGVIYNPLSEEMFWAARGHGAYLGEHRLTGSARTTLAQAVVGTCFAYHGKGDTALCAAQLARVAPRVSGVRSPGSAALEIAYVAEGRFDAFWSAGAKLDLWDIAAGVVIAREAGCLVSEIDGTGDPLACRSLLAAAPQFHAPLVQTLTVIESATKITPVTATQHAT